MLAFVTPCHGRLALTEICLRHRAWAIDAARRDYEVVSIVIANDESLEVARSLGFETVERDNHFLGRRFNDGYQKARELGASHVLALGSDCWLHPAALPVWPDDRTLALLPLMSVVRADGRERLDMRIEYQTGFTAAMAVPLAMLPERPCVETIQRGCDSSAWRTLDRNAMKRETPIIELDFVGFQSYAPQITNYEKLRKWAYAVEGNDPFAALADIHPPEFVGAVRRLSR